VAIDQDGELGNWVLGTENPESLFLFTQTLRPSGTPSLPFALLRSSLHAGLTPFFNPGMLFATLPDN
jgi:hypothetical protein